MNPPAAPRPPLPLLAEFVAGAPSAIGITEVDAEGEITVLAATTAQARQFGLTVEQIIGRQMRTLLTPEALADQIAQYRRAKALGSMEFEVAGDSEALIRRFVSLWWLGTVGPGRDRFAVVALDVDVSDRVRARRELSQLLESYKGLLRSLPDSMFRVDANGTLVELHQAPGGHSLFAARPERGATFAALFEPSVRESVDAGIRRALATGELQSLDVAGADAGGLPMVLELRLVRSGANEVTIVHRDMTSTRRMQEKLVLSERMVSFGTLASGIAHEVNNPLALVTTNLAFVTEQLAALRLRADADTAPLLDEAARALAEASAGADRVRRTVRDLRSFAQPAGDGPGLVDVTAVMESCLRVAANQIRHRARLVRAFEAVPRVMGSNAGLAQLFSNLVSNAAQSLDTDDVESNEVRVVVRAEGRQVVIEVQDTGRGVPPEIASRVFDPFFTTRSIGEGAGLGLAICHRIVQDHDGTISLRARPDRGTIVEVRLPTASTAMSSTPRPFAKLTPGERLSVLVVDDEPLLGSAVARMLRGKHALERETSARAALARVEAGERWDVILCDLMMPELTGMDLYEAVMRVAPAQACAFVFMTGGAFTPRARAFLAELNQPRLDKPFTRDELDAALIDAHGRRA